jgi:hypothetical protein
MFRTKFIKEKPGTNFWQFFFQKSLQQNCQRKIWNKYWTQCFFKKFRNKKIYEKKNRGTKIGAKTFWKHGKLIKKSLKFWQKILQKHWRILEKKNSPGPAEGAGRTGAPRAAARREAHSRDRSSGSSPGPPLPRPAVSPTLRDPRAAAPEAGVAPGSSPAPAVPRTAYSPGEIAAGAACIAGWDPNEKEEELRKRKGEHVLRWWRVRDRYSMY